MILHKSYTTKNRCYTNAKKINVTGLMLHSTGCAQPKASVYINRFNSASAGVAVHAFIQEDGNVYQTLPWNYKAWHCGSGPKGSGNTHMIGVEVCEPGTIKYTGGANWKDLDPAKTKASVMATYKIAVELFAYLANMYHLDPLKDGVVICHCEGHTRGIASGHADILHLWKPFGLTMDQFRKDVATAMKTGKAPATATTSTTTTTTKTTSATPVSTNGYSLYKVTNVKAGDALNVREAPKGKVIGKLSGGMITQAKPSSDGWYPLMTGGCVDGTHYLTPYVSPYKLTVANFKIRTKANMNVRTAPVVASGNITGLAKTGNVFTVVATYGSNWALLKSGGFINIAAKYVDKL